MKKVFAFILAMVMLLSMGLSAFAALPDALKKQYNNYSASYTCSLSLGDVTDLLGVLEEVGALEELEKYVDLKTLLTTAFQSTEKMNLQADISANYDKMKIAMVSEAQGSVTFNPNLTVSAKAQSGLWLELDLSATEPVFRMITSTPQSNKYMVYDLMEMMSLTGAEEEKEMFVAMLKAVFNKEFMTAMQEKSTALLEQHASVKVRGNRVELVIDNDALIAMLNDTLQMVIDIYAQIAKAYGNEYIAEMMAEEIPQIPNIQLLGKDGIKIEYTLSRGKISAMSMAMDFHLNMAGFAAMLEEEWPFAHQGILDIGIHMNGKMTSIGTTKVTFPTLTEENSLDFVEEMMKLYPAPEVMEEMPEYPYYWVDGWAEELPVVNNKFYVPLRDTLTGAYGETVTFGFENGKITVACEYFNGFKTLSFVAGDTTVYADEMAATIDPVLLQNGTTYISIDAVEGIFGWELSELTHDLLMEEYYYSFWTE